MDETESYKVVLDRDPTHGFGFSICGGQAPPGLPLLPIIVSKIRENTPAGNSKMCVGHMVLEINGRNLVGCRHQDAVDALKASPSTMTLRLAEERTDWHLASAPDHFSNPSGAQERADQSYLPRRLSIQRVIAPNPFEHVKVLHSFQPQRKDELAMSEGDIIDVFGKGRDGWCIGVNTRTGLKGFFPGNFVMKIRIPQAQPPDEAIYAEINQGDDQEEDIYERLPDERDGDNDDTQTQSDAERHKPAGAQPGLGDNASLDLYDGADAQTNGDQNVAVVNGDVYAVVSKGAKARPQPLDTMAEGGLAPDSDEPKASAVSPIYATVNKPGRDRTDSEEDSNDNPEQQAESRGHQAHPDYEQLADDSSIYASIDDPASGKERSHSGQAGLDTSAMLAADDGSVSYMSTSDLGIVDEVYDRIPPPLLPRNYRRASDQDQAPPSSLQEEKEMQGEEESSPALPQLAEEDKVETASQDGAAAAKSKMEQNPAEQDTPPSESQDQEQAEAAPPQSGDKKDKKKLKAEEKQRKKLEKERERERKREEKAEKKRQKKGKKAKGDST